MEHLNLLQRIENKSASFSKGQKRLAQYITDNFDTAAYLTASKLGKEAGVSESTVVRFAYQLDYDGYPELQKAIQVISKLIPIRCRGCPFPPNVIRRRAS